MFAGEKVREHYLAPAAGVEESESTDRFRVVTLEALVRMKLTSFRAKDEAHIEILDQCGLISAEVAAALPDVLKSRLDQAGSRYSADEFDPS